MIAVVRMRGEPGTRRDVADTLKILGLRKVYSATVVEDTPVNMGMIKKVGNFVAWGEADEETVSLLRQRRSLKPPKGGLRSKKLHFPKGNLGNNGGKINDLIRRMV